ncbi:MAG: phosphotransferase [Pseudomonadota bacterium]
MTDRPSLRSAFLTASGWGAARMTDLAGDASNRKYFRLTDEGQRAVLMDAPPDKGEDICPFMAVTDVLRAQSLSAPEVLAADQEAGFLLLEDLGDDLFARVLAAEPHKERDLYEAATDVLIHLHQAECPTDLAEYDAPLMADLAALAFDWYAQGATGQDFTDQRTAFARAFEDRLAELDDLTDVLVQRDYHAENLLWLPARTGVARVGLLDFQDAIKGHRAYDLVSLLQDARRDVSLDVEKAMIDHYVTVTGLGRIAFERAYALLGLQRNLRIIGVFARLCLRDRKPHYIDMIPRVWAHMVRDRNMANLPKLETDILNTLPPPSADTLNILRQKCGTLPDQ